MSEPGSSKKSLAEFWDKSRSYYELASSTNAVQSAERQAMLSYLEEGARVLDVGCGSCENSLWVPESCSYVGTDVSTTGLVLAREEARPAETVRSDGEALPFADESFDAVISTYALEHFHDPGRTLLEAARVVRPGGWLLVVGSAWDLPYELAPSLDPNRKFEIFRRRLGRQVGAWVSGKHRFDIVREPRVLTEGYVPDADAVHLAQSYFLARFLRAAGLDVVERRCLPHGPAPTGAKRWLRRAIGAVPLWSRAWGNTFLAARRGPALHPVSYRLDEI